MKKSEFIVPVITAFDENGKIDADANVTVWKRLVANQVDGILITGSNGEFFTLTPEERVSLARLAVESGITSETTVIVGTGCNSLDATVELSNQVLAVGIDAVMVVPPFYFQLGREATLRYFQQLAARVEGKIFLYNFPARTGNDLDASLVAELVATCPNIIGIKDTVTEMGHTRAIIEATKEVRPDFIVYSGFDENFAHNALAGGNGCIAALANVYPELTHAWTVAVDSKDLDRIEAIQQIVDALAEIYDVAPLFVPVIKYAVSCRGVDITTVCRSTPLELTDEQKQHAERILARADAQIAQAGVL